MLTELGRFAVTNAILEVPSDRICVDGIRVPGHARPLQEYGIIVAIDCPQDIRYTRAIQRARGLDRLTFDEFLEDEAREARSEDPFSASTLTVMEMADYRIDGSRPLDVVKKDFDPIVAEILER